MSFGILAAIIAMLCWGFGDFLIQRSTRKIGDWETLFLITLFGSVVLLPFVWHDLPIFLQNTGPTFWILVAAGLLLFVAALLEFEALKEGKISVIEPTWSLEIPVAAILATLILGESLNPLQILLIATLIVGLFFVSYKGEVTKKFFLEKGVLISVFAAIMMGTTNFFVGWGARETSPLVINFVISFVSLVGSFIFLVIKKKTFKTISHLVKYPKMLLSMMVLDNAAWIAFAFAMTLAPIGITVALSESYIIIAVILGIFINKESLSKRQHVGLLVALTSAIILATITI